MLLRIMTNWLVIGLILFVCIFLLIKYLEHTAVFFPGKTIENTPNQMGLAYEDLYLTTADGIKINAWLVKSSSHAATMIFAHGNAGTMGERIMKLRFFHDLGLNVLIFDYRGYARSEGKPSEKGIYLDAQAVYDYLQTRPDINGKRLIGYGASLGGVVVTDLATQRPLAALIVESSFTSAADMAHRLYPFLPSFMMGIKFDSISKIGKVSGPKLFLHSREDRTVPFSMGEQLFQTASDPKRFIVIQGGHNDGSLTVDSKAQLEFKQFLQEHSFI